MGQLTDFTRLLKDAVTGTADMQAQAEKAALWIHGLRDTNLWVYWMLLSYVHSPPAEVLASLALYDGEVEALKGNPRALAFIGALQRRLNGA